MPVDGLQKYTVGTANAHVLNSCQRYQGMPGVSGARFNCVELDNRDIAVNDFLTYVPRVGVSCCVVKARCTASSITANDATRDMLGEAGAAALRDRS